MNSYLLRITLKILSISFFYVINFNVHAQGCTGGTTITGVETSPIVFSSNNDCLTVNQSGSLIVGSIAVAVDPDVTGIGINNASLISSSANAIQNLGGGINILINSSGASVSGAVVGVANLSLSSSINSIDNSGTISSSTSTYSGIYNEGSVGSLENRSGSFIIGHGGVFNSGSASTITTINNSGTIRGYYSQGIHNEGIIRSLTNDSFAEITGDGSSIVNSGIDSLISSLINFGTIAGIANQGIDNSGTISSLINNSGATISGFGSAIYNNGASSLITNLSNSGSIIGGPSYYGIDNRGTIITLANNSGGSITGGNRGILNLGTIGSVQNSGTISASQFGILSSGTITTLTNSGTIFSEATGGVGIYNSGTIATLTNTGTVSAENMSGRGIFNVGTIEILNNFGTVSNNIYNGTGIENYGSITSLTNSGAIYGGYLAITNSNLATIAALNNSGTISSAENGVGIENFGTITTLTNSGTILAGNGGMGVASGGVITTLNNLGTISAGDEGYGIGNGGTITTLTNSGTISAGHFGFGIYNDLSTSITTLTNAGTISAGDEGYGIVNIGTITTLTNSGTISSGDYGKGIYNGGLINTLNNTGSINGDVWVTCDGLGSCNSIARSSGRINTLNNLGTINGDVVLWMDAPTPGALPSIGTLNNSGSLNSIYLQYLTGEGVAIETVNNSGRIRNGIDIAGVLSEASAGIGTLVNSGTIDGGIQIAGIISASGGSGAGIRSFINTGIVNGGIDIQHIQDLGVPLSGIELLTNTGSIIGGITVSDIFGASTGIGTLNNLQGGASSSALAYSGKLPNNYNIIVNSATQYGQLVASEVAGTMVFGVMEGPSFPTGTYRSVLSGISTSNISAGLSGIHNNYYFWSLVPNANNVWDMSVYFDISSNTTGFVSIDNLTGSGPAILGTQSLLLTAASGTYSGVISGSGGITINGGEWILTGANTYSGGTTVSTGTLQGNSTSLQGAIVNNSQVIFDQATNGTYSGVMSGTGSLTKQNAGTLILTGANTYSGGTTVSAGTLQGNTTSLQGVIINNSQVVFDQATNGTYSGVMSGTGSLTKQNTGTLIMTGANTYTGGTTVSSGTLSVAGSSPTGTGAVTIASGATLMGRGTITGAVNVSGNLKPGNSPGYLSTTSTVTMNTGSTYLQDIAGTVQASNTSPVGATGYYSFLNVTNGQFVIQPGSTLAPQLSNLFTADQSGFGSAIYVPGLGNRMRIVTAAGGISGKFSTVTQPAELAVGTQFLPFYNMAGSNSIDLAVIPTSYQTTIAAVAGNANAQSVGGALTQIAQASLTGTATASQNQLLYAISGQSSAQGISNLAQGMSGEVYAATVAVMAQTTQRTQQAVLNRLGDTAGLGMNSPMASASMTTSPGGAPGAAVSSNPQVNPNAEAKTFSNRNLWGDLAYQKGNRSNDSQSGGWSSNLYQLVFGSDLYASNGTILGAGFALSSTTVNPVYGSANIQQGSLFAYGKMPVESFVVDAMASIGLSSSDIKRSDLTGLSSGFRNNSVSGNDVMLSLGLSRPMDLESVRITPYARVTWQMVTQSSVNEGGAASALSVNGYTGNGVRGVIGIAAGSKANNPMTAKNTYRAYVGIGADSSGLLNPTLNASLAGMNTSISTPNAGTAFVQAGLYGTAKMSENTFAYAGISGEARSGQMLGTINVGLKLQF